MNPILRNKGVFAAYVALMLSAAALYSALLGSAAGLDAWTRVLDGAVYWVVYGLQGIVVWNMLRYGVLRGRNGYTGLGAVLLGFMTVVIVAGIECLAMWAHMGSGFGAFAATIPLRIFVTALIYIILLLYYAGRIAEQEREIEERQVIEVVAESRVPRSDALERITIRTGGRIKVISVGEIDYLQAEGDYVAVVTPEGRWLKEHTMKYFEEHLSAAGFVRIHRSYIVALAKITRIERVGNLYQVVLCSGEKIKVSATGYRLLKERLDL